VLADVLRGEGSAVVPTQSQLVLEMEKLSLDVMPRKESTFAVTLLIQPMTIDRIKEAQASDPKLTKLKAMANKGKTPHFWVTRVRILR
jgi:hypothetical protein